MTLPDLGSDLLSVAVRTAIVYVVLAFPTGRLTEQVDRVLAGVAAGVVLILYLPNALLVETYLVPRLVPRRCGTAAFSRARALRVSQTSVRVAAMPHAG